MGSLLAALTTIVVTVLAALLALPHFMDWNAYKPQIEEQIGALAGREVRILGDVDLRVLPVPRLDMRGLRIADEFGKFEQPFAEVESFNAILSIPSLMTGTLEARSVLLDQPIIRLKIDEFNEGTWLSLGPYGLSYPLPVSDVALNRVTITDGAIELRRAHPHSVARFDRITGEFSSKGLSGPFRFDGAGIIGGGLKTVQLSAAKVPGRPELRLKAALRSADGVSLYQLDGEIRGLDGPVHYSGPLAARIALDETAQKAETGQIAEPMAGKAIELRSEAKITLEDATLDDLTVTVTQNDRPQSINGKAYASWADAPRLDLDVESSWLDFDEMMRSAAGDEKLLPSAAIASLPRIFEGWAFRPRQGRISAKIQQAGLAGDIVEKLNFSASHDQQGWRIDMLTARLPGETDFNGSGALPAGDDLNFTGNITFNGQNLSRLLRWSAPSLGVVDAGNAQSFSLSAGVKLSANQLEFTEASGALGESSFTGDLIHAQGDESLLIVSLNSDLLDLRGLYNPDAGNEEDGGVEEIAEVLGKNVDGGVSWNAEVIPSRKTSLADVLMTVFKADRSTVSLTIAALQLPDFQARNLRTEFRYDRGAFDIDEFNVATTDGLRVDASGRMTGFDSTPNGALNLTIDAPSAQSVTNLARFAGLDSVSRAARSRIEALSPFNLRGSLNASAGDSILRMSLAGSAGGSELTINGSLRGSLDELDNARVEVKGGMGNADSAKLIAQLAPEVPAERSGAQGGAGFLEIALNGTMKTGLTSLIQLRTPQANGKFDGQISPLSEPSWSFDGLLDMRAAQAATALSMLRVSPGGEPVTGPIDLRAAIRKDASNFRISDLTLQIGGEIITGAVDADLSGERPAGRIDIEAASVSLPKIAAYLVDWERRDYTSDIASAATGGSPAWPSQAFAFEALTGVDGALTVKAPRIGVASGVSLSGGSLKASMKAGKLTLEELSGQLYGGRFKGSGSLTRLSGRIGADVALELENFDLAELSRAHGGGEVVRGAADLKLTATGEGLSPSGLVSMLSGSGELSLRGGAFLGLSHAALKDAAETYLRQEIPSKQDLAAKLEKDFFQGEFAFAPVTLPVSIRDGVLRVGNAAFNGGGAEAQASLTVDLASLRFDSEWTVASPETVDGGAALPPVRLVFAGPLDRFSSVKADMNADGFERFLTIRRMDQDMERLERLQKERGLPPSAQPRARQPAPPRESATATAPPPALAPGEQDATVPEQSLLRAPPVTLEQPPATETAPPPKADSAASGWSTGVENAAEDQPGEDAEDRGTAGAGPPGQPSASFEDQIRNLLRAQERSAQPSIQ